MENYELPPPVLLEIDQGEILVNEGWEQTCELKLLQVDLKSKYAEAMALCQNEGVPEVMLYADERTLNVSEEHKPHGTMLKFPEYEGWEAFAAWVGRYTLTVILKKVV